MIFNNITELIGNTPILKLNSIVSKNSADVFLKLENLNPSKSVKDRAALNMILEAEKQGLIKPGATIIEPSSGNTGIGLAMVASAKGYKSIIIMPETATTERVNLLKAYGAEVILTPGEKLMSGSIEKAKELLNKIPNSFMPDQFNNMSNPDVHKKTTALEILDDMENSLDAFVATAGTGGTISGTGEILKKHIPSLKIYVVESENSRVIAGGEPGPHKIVGTGPGFIPSTLDRDIFDDIIHISDKDAINTTKLLAQKEGVLCGISSGASTYVALKIAEKLGPGKKVLAIAPDTGERYLSMDII